MPTAIEDYLDGDDDIDGDDDLYGEDDDLYGEDDDDEVGARTRRQKRRIRRRRRGMRGNQLIRFNRVAVAAGATAQLTVTLDRDCRPLDLRVQGSVAATGVVDPGVRVDDLQSHGKSFFASAGGVDAAFFSPLAQGVLPNCDIAEVIRSGEQVTLTVTNVTAAAISVSGTLLVRAKI